MIPTASLLPAASSAPAPTPLPPAGAHEAVRGGRDDPRRASALLARGESGEPVAEPARLSSRGGDTMTLHTGDALRLFAGQGADARWRVPPLDGGKHFAYALKEIWYLSARDHPYADWMLIRAYDALGDLNAALAVRERALLAQVEALQQRGLSISIMASTRPVEVSLGFRSPYGYAVAAATVAFDHYARVVHTLMQTDQMNPREGRRDIDDTARFYYALFRQAMQWKRELTGDALRALTRADFGERAGEPGRARVQAAVALFGALPREVLDQRVMPRHSRVSRTAVPPLEGTGAAALAPAPEASA